MNYAYRMFMEDLAFGHKYEDVFIEKILGNPEDLNRPAGRFSQYDFSVNGVNYEIKADRKCSVTGRFCIEAQKSGSPSGISTTQAHYYGYFVVRHDGDYDIYKIPTADILQMIIDKKYTKSMRGGDGWKSFFYLFDKELFSQYKVYATSNTVDTAADCSTGSVDC
jgi:hypothetical protein